MTDPAMEAVEMYFEFASPYAYLSSEVIEPLCQRLGVPLIWKPIMLGPIIRRTGARPLYVDGVRGQYAKMDCFRWARRAGIPFRHWPAEPVNSLKAARGALHLAGTALSPPAGTARESAFIHACFRAHFEDGLDLYEEAVLAEIVTGLGEDAEAFLAGIAEPDIKQRLADETEAAYRLGVFGSPTFIHRGEMLWGNDRLPMLEELIREGRPE